MDIEEGDLKSLLIKSVKSRQVAFQYCDELVDFTLDGADDKSKELLFEIDNNNVCLIENRQKDRGGFEEILDWAIPSDLLFMIDNYLIICVSRSNK